MVTIDTWQAQMSEDMRLRDFRPRTQEGYMAAARQFIDWIKRGPETATDKDVRAYFLYLREEKQLAPSTISWHFRLKPILVELLVFVRREDRNLAVTQQNLLRGLAIVFMRPTRSNKCLGDAVSGHDVIAGDVVLKRACLFPRKCW